MARLFYAIWPDGAARAALGEASRRLRECGRARFVPGRNLHLTLYFLGETERIGEAAACLDGPRAEPFSLALGGLGRFERREGDVFWAGVAPAPALTALQAALVEAVARAGFPVEKRPYTPHITLARRMRLHKGMGPGDWEGLLPPCAMEVGALCLLESVRDEEGLLSYRTVAERRLE